MLMIGLSDQIFQIFLLILVIDPYIIHFFIDSLWPLHLSLYLQYYGITNFAFKLKLEVFILVAM